MAEAAPGQTVLFDRELANDLMGRQFRYIFETHDLQYETVDQLASVPVPAGESRVVALRTSSLAQFGPNARLTPLLAAVDEPRGARFGIYWLEYPSGS